MSLLQIENYILSIGSSDLEMTFPYLKQNNMKINHTNIKGIIFK